MALLGGLFLALVALGMIVLANYGVGRPAVATASFVVVGLMCGLVAMGGLLDALLAASPLVRGDHSSMLKVGGGLGFSGVVAGLMVVPAVRRGLARVLPIDPASPVHALALAITVLLVGTQLSAQLSTDLLSQAALTGTPLTPVDLVAQEVPFLLGAFFGVGWLIRRSAGDSLLRLGLIRPAWWHIVLGLAVAGAFVAFSSGAELLGQRFTPELAHKVQAANERLFGQLGNPLGVATIALAAGICEEILFRGALLPRLGIAWTSIVFAAVHTQYGLSVDTVAVLLLALALGYLRRFTNTTTTVVCHVAYNGLVGLGLGASWWLPALALEAILVGLLLVVLTRQLGRSRQAA